MSDETPQERAKRFLDEVPEFAGTMEEAFAASDADARASMAAKWGAAAAPHTVLMTAPHDGHEATATCPACPHPGVSA